MLRYEIKKVFTRAGSKIALALLAIILIAVSMLAVKAVGWVDENGEAHTGYGAVLRLKKEQSQWSGQLTEEKIADVIRENARISATPQSQSKDVQQNNMAYSWQQPIQGIRDLINRSFGGFRDYDYYRIDSLEPEDSAYFYTNRLDKMKEWLYGEAKDQYSDAQKAYFITQYEKLEVPINYDFLELWESFLEMAPTIIMLTAIILGFLLSGIFAGEAGCKADSIFYASLHGRNKAISAKIGAGMCIITVVYWITVLLYTLLVMGVTGFRGADCAIQAMDSGWKSFYNITVGQEYFMVIAGGYIGCLFLGSCTMLVSALANTVLAVMTPFLLIFIPSFLSAVNHPVISKVVGLLPDQLLQMNVVVKLFNAYQVGGIVLGAAGILLVMYLVLTVAVWPGCYWGFKKREVK